MEERAVGIHARHRSLAIPEVHEVFGDGDTFEDRRGGVGRSMTTHRQNSVGSVGELNAQDRKATDRIVGEPRERTFLLPV